MFREFAYNRGKEFIIFENAKEFEELYDYKEKCIGDRYNLSKAFLPTAFPCAYEVKNYAEEGIIRYNNNNCPDYLKPCSLYYAYYECTITLQQTIHNLQNYLDRINTKFSSLNTKEDE